MKIELTEDKLLELQQIQRNVTGADYVKVTGILMLNKGLTPRTVSESLGIDVSTVYRYAALYIGGGVTALTANSYKGYRGMLSSHELSLLRTELKRNIHIDSKSICLWIKDSFGVLYTPGGVVDLLKRIGFTYKKTGGVLQSMPIQTNPKLM